jgi:hypothetical protein
MTINRMLTDRQYLGYLITKDVTSPHLPELQIIDDQTFQRAVEIVEQRKKINAEWRKISRRSNNGMLLGGNLYCGHCGSRMPPPAVRARESSVTNPNMSATRVPTTASSAMGNAFILLNASMQLLSRSQMKSWI